MKTNLPLGTELLIGAYLAKVHNFNDRYQLNVARKMTRDAVSSLFYEFDMQNVLNKRLVAMCIQKGIFVDDSQQSVVYTLMMYGKELQEFRAENLGSIESAVENLVIEDNFRPDPRLAR